MKPPPFDYVAARSLDEAVESLARSKGDGKVLAGGQSLTPMLNFRLARPSLLVDINRISGLSEISKDNGGLRLGALVRHRAVETSPVVREKFPMLTAAAEHVGHLAIRNRGTFGGSVAHNDPAAEWPMMALLLDAEVRTHRPGGGRTIPIRDFLITFLSTALEPNEILTEVRLPGLPAGSGWGFEELSRRPGDFALAAVAALVVVERGTCKEARIAMAGVGPTALRAPQAEGMLRGQRLEPELLKQAATRAAEAADPSNDVHASADYRRHLVSVLTRRALEAAARRAA
jgi:carbon-monoxide dehydrogenase medium subunit